MKKKYLLFISLTIVFIFLAGCFPFNLLGGEEEESEIPPLMDKSVQEQENDSLRSTGFYFLADNEEYLVPVHKKIQWTEGIARAAIENMVEGVKATKFLEGSGLKPVFPLGTELLGLTVRDGLAIVDFNKKFLDYPEENERDVVTALLYTLTEFPTIERVELLIEGTNMETMPNGLSVSSEMTRKKGINIEIADDLDALPVSEKIILYFNTRSREEDMHYYVPITRVVAPRQSLTQSVATELLKGPAPGSSVYSAIPQDTELIDLVVKDGVASIDLSSHLLDFQGGSEAERNIVDQILFTFTELPDVQQVQIFVEGEPKTMPNGTELGQLLSRPQEVNSVN